MEKVRLLINGVDVHAEYGVGLEPGGSGALMAPAAMKEPVTNKNVTADGAVVVCSGHVSDRMVSVPIHMVGRGVGELLSRRQGFIGLLRGSSPLTVTLEFVTGERLTYTMYYISCNQYSQHIGSMAKFVLTLYEPLPSENHTASPEPAP